MNICIYIFMYKYVYICIYMFIHMRTYTHLHNMCTQAPPCTHARSLHPQTKLPTRMFAHAC